MIRHFCLSALLLTCAASAAAALEATATRGGNDSAANSSLLTRMNASDAALQATLNAVLKCNNKGKMFVSAPAATGKDADGCKEIPLGTSTLYDVTMVTEHKTDTFASLPLNKYTITAAGKKGYSGYSNTQSINLAPIIDKGGSAITISFTRAGFSACNGAATITLTNPGKSENNVFGCHYDSSPNRSTNLYWSYDAGAKRVYFHNTIGQNKGIPTAGSVASPRVTYTVQKLRLTTAK